MLREERMKLTDIKIQQTENILGRKLTTRERKKIQREVLKTYRKVTNDKRNLADDNLICGANKIIKSRLSKDANPVDHFVHLVLRWSQLLESGKEFKVISCEPVSVQCPGLSLGDGKTSHCTGKIEDTTKMECCPVCEGSGTTGGLWILAQRLEDKKLHGFELVVYQDYQFGTAEIVCTGQFEQQSEDESNDLTS